MTTKKNGTTLAVMHGPGTIGTQWCDFIQKMFTEDLPEECRDMNLDLIAESVSNLGEDDVSNINNCQYKMLLLDSEVLKIVKDTNSIFRQCEIMEMQQEQVIVLLLGSEDDSSFNQDARSSLSRLKDSEAYNIIQAKNPDQIFSDIMTILSPMYIVPHPSIMSCEDKEQHLTLISSKPFPTGQHVEYVVEFSVGKQSKETSATIFNPYTLLLQNPGQLPGVATVRIYACTCNPHTQNDMPEVSRTQIGEDLKVWFQSDLDKVFSILDSQMNPMAFLCQVIEDGRDENRTIEEKVDKLLTESFKTYVPDDKLSIVFGNAQNFGDGQDGNRPEFLPTLLHFSAMYGLRDLTAALLQCPGAVHAYGTANCDGDFPTNLAEKSGHWELRDFMQTFMEVAAMVHDDFGKNNTQTSQIMSGMFYGQYLSLAGDSGITEDIYEPIEAGGSGTTTTSPGYVQMRAANLTASLPQSADYDYMIKRMLEHNSEEPEKDYEELDIPGPPIEMHATAVSAAPPPPPPRDDKKPIGSLDPQDTPLLLLPTIHSNMSPAQEELISLQKQVKNGELTINQAVFRFKEWERKHKERAASFQFQQENLQRIRSSLMRSRQERKKKGESTSIKISDPLVAGSSTYDVVLLRTRKEVIEKPTNEGLQQKQPTEKLTSADGKLEQGQYPYSPGAGEMFRPFRGSIKKQSFTPPRILPERPPGLSMNSQASSRYRYSARSNPTDSGPINPPLPARQWHTLSSPARISISEDARRPLIQRGPLRQPVIGQAPPLPPRDEGPRRIPVSHELKPAVPPRSPINR